MAATLVEAPPARQRPAPGQLKSGGLAIYFVTRRITPSS